MSKYDSYRTISQLAGIGTEELNNMSKKDMYNLIQRFGAIAIRRRYNVQSFFDQYGMNPPQQYSYENKSGMRSWRLADFDVSRMDSAGKMKSVLRNIQNYLQSDFSTLEGIRKQERNMYYSLAKRIGVPTYMDNRGRERVNTLSKEYKEFSRAINKLSGYNGPRQDKFIKRYENTRLMWEIIDKVQEIYKDETQGASSRIQIATIRELSENSSYTISDTVFNIVDRLRGEYVERQEQERANAPRYTSQTDFFDEEGD